MSYQEMNGMDDPVIYQHAHDGREHWHAGGDRQHSHTTVRIDRKILRLLYEIAADGDDMGHWAIMDRIDPHVRAALGMERDRFTENCPPYLTLEQYLAPYDAH